MEKAIGGPTLKPAAWAA